MQLYKRNIKYSLYVLRLLLIVMIVASIYLFMHRLHDYGYLLITIALACTLIPVIGFEADTNVITVKKYYLFALACKTTRFYKGESLRLEPFDIDLTDAGDEATGSGVWGLFLLSMPYKTAIRKITITQQANNCKRRKATITLANAEYKLLQAFIETETK